MSFLRFNNRIRASTFRIPVQNFISTGGVKQLRCYTPVRPRDPRPPRRRVVRQYPNRAQEGLDAGEMQTSQSNHINQSEYDQLQVEQKNSLQYSSNFTGYSPQGYAQWDTPVSNPGGVLQPSDAVVSLLSYPTLVMERKIEMMNVFLGFEQANRYAILDQNGVHLGYMEEEDFGITKAIMRQIYRLHRPFSVRVLDRHENHIMTIRRPFSFINSHIKAILPSPDGDPANQVVIGETKQQWHLFRRKYNLFLQSAEEKDVYDQFGKVDAPFLAFSFPVVDREGAILGVVDRNWVGLGRELFTDTGVYVLRMDPSSFDEIRDIYPNLGGPLTLDQRAVMLGTAVSIDFDYFSRHSNRGYVLFRLLSMTNVLTF
ncbi:Aim25p [Sugiyamaella lignohabitans]|uniref:Phospholipid scramblase n=1 Tax=Sugiyamaella lignohabitans TaxID=796027 RepID=A0A167DUS5_9ASCO|nr:Aim25p [Sugiyamaella lignohabitans]ANB13314.1 Aim25p [Sugiyamaella lignohabitans]